MIVSLTDELANFVKTKVAGGRYGSASEVVREALRLMEKVERQEAEQLTRLRAAWKEGIDSGDAGEVDFAALKREARARKKLAKQRANIPTALMVSLSSHEGAWRRRIRVAPSTGSERFDKLTMRSIGTSSTAHGSHDLHPALLGWLLLHGSHQAGDWGARVGTQ